MSLLSLALDPAIEARATMAQALRAEAQAQGFADPLILEAPAATVVWAESPEQRERERSVLIDPTGFIALTGVLMFDQLVGQKALQALWGAFCGEYDIAPERLGGNFQAVLHAPHRTWVLSDAIGMLKLYEVASQHMASTSWLACARLTHAPRVDEAASLEYLVTASNHHRDTPLAQVKIVPPGLQWCLRTGQQTALTNRMQLRASEPLPIAQAVAQGASLLSARFESLCTEYAQGMVNALSGGFDSRMILAGLMRHGAKPELYVFGRASSDDVRFAYTTAQRLGLALTHVDKAHLNASLVPIDTEELRRSMNFFDGIPSDGIFDRGADRITRTRFGAHGSLLLNGGCGEIFRNFFYLPDRSFRAIEIVDTFFSNFHHAVFARPDDFQAYRAAMSQTIEAHLHTSGAIERSDIELLYPLLRARFWISRNNSVANRIGRYLTPLIDVPLVRISQSVPIQEKNFGAFQAKLIHALHPEAAAPVSGYGFSFSAGPNWRYRTSQRLTFLRPPSLRAQSARIKWMLSGSKPVPLPSEWAAFRKPHPKLESRINTGFFTHTDQWNRLLTLETVFAEVGAT
jgi:asparagine synthase (glutamine-hydrolysing)